MPDILVRPIGSPTTSPPFSGPSSHRLAEFRGQRQKWFALRFAGSDEEIDPLTSRNGQPPEFDQWRWERLDRVADLVVPFRRDVYRAVAYHFAPFAEDPTSSPAG
jgi:putative (di)nucleoside polyphosphate hydrolase